jgi:hypothetical protein
MRRLVVVFLTCFEAFLLIALAYGITVRSASTDPKRLHPSATSDRAMVVACNAAKPLVPFSCGDSIDRRPPATRRIVRFLHGSRLGESVSHHEKQRGGTYHEIKVKPQSEQTASKLLDAAGLLDKLLVSLGALAPAVLAIAVLTFGKSLHFIEASVERTLDRLLFGRRLRLRRNLKCLLADCTRFASADDLVRVCADQLRALTGARRIAFYELRDGGYIPSCSDWASLDTPDRSFFVPLHRDDQAMLRITARRGPVEAVGLATALPPKSVVFPMLSAGRLVGAVVCEGQPERFDPDERRLIADFIHDIGATLVFLRSAYHSPAALTENAVYDISHIWSHSRSAALSEEPQPA